MSGIDLLDRLPGGLNLRLRDVTGYHIVDREITGQDEGGITITEVGRKVGKGGVPKTLI